MLRRLNFGVLCFFVAVLLVSGCAKKPIEDIVDSAKSALAKEEYNRAIELLSREVSAEDVPLRKSELYTLLGVAYYRNDDVSKAVQAFKSGIELNPASFLPAYNLGVIMIERGNPETAVEWFKKAASNDPDDVRAYEYLGWIYTISGQLDEARAVLKEALSNEPHSARIITSLSLVELKADEVDKGRLLLHDALEKDSGFLPAIYNLGVLNKSWLDNRKESTAYFKEFIRRSPGGLYSGQAHAALHELSVNESVDEPVEKKKPSKKPEKVVSESPETEHKSASRKKPRVKRNSVSRAMEAAEESKADGRIQQAVTNYLYAAKMAQKNNDRQAMQKAEREAVALCSKNAPAQYAVGIYCLSQGEISNAMQHFKRAVSIDSDFYQAYMALADIAADLGELDTALLSLKYAVQIQPSNPDALWALARLYDAKLGLKSQSVKCYRAFLTQFPDDPRAEVVKDCLNELEKE